MNPAYNFDYSFNNIDFVTQFMNTLPIPPSRQNMNMNPFPFSPFIENPLPNSMEDMLTNSFLQINPYKKVTSDEAIENIKKLEYDNNFEQKECPITMMDFEEGEEISELPCKHLFNTEAINRWLKDENYRCPVCRYELDFKEVKKYDISGIDISNNITPDISGAMNFFNNMLEPNSNQFEILINLIQGEIRRNYYSSQMTEMIQEINTTLDSSFDEELQQVLWNSMNDMND
ncbi:MAG TPA: hypothetical protein EYQ68_02335 [Cytophagales bacterium]|nr:hypothetical protein [Cytophagales bacterium]